MRYGCPSWTWNPSVRAYQRVHIPGIRGIAQPCTGRGTEKPIRSDPTRDWISARSAWFTMISAKHIPPFPARGRNFDGITAAVAWSPRNTLVVVTSCRIYHVQSRDHTRARPSPFESGGFSTFIFVPRLPGFGLSYTTSKYNIVQCYRALIILWKAFSLSQNRGIANKWGRENKTKATIRDKDRSHCLQHCYTSETYFKGLRVIYSWLGTFEQQEFIILKTILQQERI